MVVVVVVGVSGWWVVVVFGGGWWWCLEVGSSGEGLGVVQCNIATLNHCNTTTL